MRLVWCLRFLDASKGADMLLAERSILETQPNFHGPILSIIALPRHWDFIQKQDVRYCTHTSDRHGLLTEERHFSHEGSSAYC